MESADSLYPWGESHVCGWGVVSLPFFWMDGLRSMCYPLGHNSSAGPRDEVCRTFEGNSNGIDRRGLWFRYQSRILLDSTVFEPWLWGLSQVLLQFYKKWFELWQLIFHCLLQWCFSLDLHKGRLFAGHVAGDSGTTLQIRKDCKSFGIICIFFCKAQLEAAPSTPKRRPVGNLNPSCLLRSAFSWGLLASWLVPRWSSRAIFLIKKHGSHDMGQNSSPTKMDGWILKISENDTNQPQINHKSTHTGVWLIEKNMTCGSSNRFSPVKDGDGHHTSSLRSTQTDRTGGRTSCDEVDLGWPFLSHSDSYQSTLWIVPLCHQVRGKTMSWFGSLAKTRLARLDVCRSLFSMLCITCSGEQIQPVEKVWRGMFWRLDPFYCALTWNVIQF